MFCVRTEEACVGPSYWDACIAWICGPGGLTRPKFLCPYLRRNPHCDTNGMERLIAAMMAHLRKEKIL